ncbi:uncharacterized protein LOC123948021 isoform X1 [Meles meles]|uniref:uncharacterized protein LOC123948021 isoform X1 n=1 Tax=Meles meles TaxID=9662 RepID=UPI001E69B2A8|nr:uncharacterized protein LOC123948021 isoform X1 [Meles meles]XP_045870374.1 uncharacterized protein LOC123948021 isoform X1 [Meles meles]
MISHEGGPGWMPKMVLTQGFKSSAKQWCPFGSGGPWVLPLTGFGDLDKALPLSRATSAGGGGLSEIPLGSDTWTRICSAPPFELLRESLLGPPGASAHPHPRPTGPTDPYWFATYQQWEYPGCCPKFCGVSLWYLLVPACQRSAGESQHRDEPGQLAGCQPWDMRLCGGADCRPHVHPEPVRQNSHPDLSAPGFTQLPQKSLLVLLLLSSVLELDITSLTTFLGFQATFDYMWPERSPQDRTGAPSPCPQCLDGYLDSAEDMPVALAAPPESPAQQVQQPPAIA